MDIISPTKAIETMRSTSYITYAVMLDGGTLCYECICNEQPLLASEYNCAISNGFTMNTSDTQWLVSEVDVNHECGDLYCSHCNEQIEPSYGVGE